MTRSILFLMIFMVSAILVSCSDAGSEKEKIAFEIVHDGTYSAIQEKRELVINTNDEYQKLMQDVYKNMDQMPRIPVVDFTKNTLIAVFVGTRSTAGYLVSIDSISESSKNLNVEVLETTPGKNCMTSDVITAPYTIVKVPKTDKKAVFKYSQKVKDCN